MNEDSIKRAIKVHQDLFLRDSNVIGMGIGLKTIKGKATSQLCMKVYVEKKIPEKNLTPSNIKIPKTLKLPTTEKYPQEEISTDVEEIGKVALLSYNGRYRPAPGGVSIGHFNVSGGTLGCLVFDINNHEVLILSNNHVLANCNNAAVGDLVTQPGRLDGGNVPTDAVAQLVRWINVDTSGGGNIIDGAVCRPLNSSLVTSTILDVGEIKGVTMAFLGMQVKKTGRTTQHTRGTVKDVNAVLRIGYGNGVAIFKDQILTTCMSAPGDSGSILLDDNNKVCGLLFAGSSLATFYNPIHYVMGMLQISLPGTEHMHVFNSPTYGGHRVDWCLHWGKDCGQPAADRFCQLMGHTHATSWKIDPDIGNTSPTIVLGDGTICDQASCDGFAYIVCANQTPAPQPPPSPPVPPQPPAPWDDPVICGLINEWLTQVDRCVKRLHPGCYIDKWGRMCGNCGTMIADCSQNPDHPPGWNTYRYVWEHGSWTDYYPYAVREYVSLRQRGESFESLAKCKMK